MVAFELKRFPTREPTAGLVRVEECTGRTLGVEKTEGRSFVRRFSRRKRGNEGERTTPGFWAIG